LGQIKHYFHHSQTELGNMENILHTVTKLLGQIKLYFHHSQTELGNMENIFLFSSLTAVCWLSAALTLLQVDVYRRRLRERERQKCLLKDYGVIQSSTTIGAKKLQMIRVKQSKDERSAAVFTARRFTVAAFKRRLKTFYTTTLLTNIVRRPCCVSALTSP